MSIAREIADLSKRIGKCEAGMPKLPTRFESAMGGGGSSSDETTGSWIEAESYPELDPASSVSKFTMARITTGDQIDQIYKVATNADDELYWKCIDETYDADSKAELVNNSYVQKFAVGRVGSIYYRRNDGNAEWEALNEFE